VSLPLSDKLCWSTNGWLNVKLYFKMFIYMPALSA
jgi:hypothetical protein